MIINVPCNEFFITQRKLVQTAIKILREKNPELNENVIFLEKNGIMNYPYESLISENDLLSIKNEKISIDCFGRPYINSIIELKNKGFDVDARLIAGIHEVALYKTTLDKQLIIMGKLIDENINIHDRVTAFSLTEPEVVNGLKNYFNLKVEPKCFFIQSNYTTLRPFFPVNKSNIFSQETSGYLLTLREYLLTNNKKLGDKLLKGVPSELDKDMIKLIKNY